MSAALEQIKINAGETLLWVENLCLAVGHGGREIVRQVTFDVRRGEIVGVVGESGSGKTQAVRAVMGLTPPPLVRTSGRIVFEGEEIAEAPQKRLQQLRGGRIGMVFQEPMTSLNPSMTIGRQLDEGLALHRRAMTPAERRGHIVRMLARVGIADPQAALQAWPHEFSGGMRQRMMLAAVMLLEPALLIADEPTTALDALVQRDVLDLMVALSREHGTAVLLISHDLPMVARYTERVVVMQNGRVVERGGTAALLARPREDYTRALLQAMPRRLPAKPPKREVPLVEVRDLVVEYPGRQRLFRRTAPKRALGGVSLDVRPGEVVAIVGSSGCGKTTLGRAIAGLLEPTSGQILFNGHPIHRKSPQWLDYRLGCQMVFQDPYSSLNPRMTVGELVGEGLRLVAGMSRAEKAARTREALAEVGLAEEHLARFPHEMSGGQRQRVAIARAIVRRPSFVIADEPVSSLDVTVRAQILDLFAELQQRHGFSSLFISHDLGVVEQIADRVIVMQDGAIVEQGSRDAVFDMPEQEYTRRLLSAIPLLEPTAAGGVRLRWRFDPTEGRADAPATDETDMQPSLFPA